MAHLQQECQNSKSGIFVLLYRKKRVGNHMAHLRQECQNSKFGIFDLLV